ncbi:Trigger factor, partial [Frankliniella fusca]
NRKRTTASVFPAVNLLLGRACRSHGSGKDQLTNCSQLLSAAAAVEVERKDHPSCQDILMQLTMKQGVASVLLAVGGHGVSFLMLPHGVFAFMASTKSLIFRMNATVEPQSARPFTPSSL